jgi:hypothetical protein
MHAKRQVTQDGLGSTAVAQRRPVFTGLRAKGELQLKSVSADEIPLKTDTQARHLFGFQS